MVKIFITGGHVTPAIAVIEEIKKRKLPWEIIFIGRTSALEGNREDSEEYRLVKNFGAKFLSLSSGRLLRTFTLSGLVSLFKIPWGVIQALFYVSTVRPKLILTFGGYLALPVAFAGFLFKIPVVTHEQTEKFGLANKLISLISLKVFASDESMLAKLASGKGVFTGLPIRKELFNPPQNPSFRLESHLPLIYITGGVTGAKSMNEIIFPIIPDLVKNYMVVHQTGSMSLSTALEIKRSLKTLERRYFAAKYFDTDDISWIYSKAILIIGRSGANTVAEMALLGKVAILIPLPWSAGDEQRENALTLKEAGSAIVLDQKAIDSGLLLRKIKEIISKMETYQANAHEYSKMRIRDGASRVVNELMEIIS